jgi:hypothetical protein
MTVKDKLVVKVTAEAVYKRKILTRIAVMGITILMLLVTSVYGIVYIVNQTGNFTISLDPNLKTRSKITMSPFSDFRDTYIILNARALDYMDNISEKWLPEDIDQYEGEHSGDNYIAYTFFIRNEGLDPINYETVINIQSVIKRVDEAVRVAVIHNGKKEVYAKVNEKTKQPEPNTTPFVSNTKIAQIKRKDFAVGDVDRFTIVIWLEGDDPECIDDILGGEMKMLMYITKSDD